MHKGTPLLLSQAYEEIGLPDSFINQYTLALYHMPFYIDGFMVLRCYNF
jgi:hypothetical protein